MSSRCPYHDDLVLATGKVLEKLDHIHEDLSEIKHDLYEAGNGGIVGWMYRRRGAMKVSSAIIGAVVSLLTAITVLYVKNVI